MRLPEIRLRLESNHAHVLHWEARENRLALLSFVTLAQFLPRAGIRVAHLQLTREFFGDIDLAAALRRQIHFLKQAKIRLVASERVGDLVQLGSAVDVPIDNVKRFGRRRGFGEIAGDDFVQIGGQPQREQDRYQILFY